MNPILECQDRKLDAYISNPPDDLPLVPEQGLDEDDIYDDEDYDDDDNYVDCDDAFDPRPSTRQAPTTRLKAKENAIVKPAPEPERKPHVPRKRRSSRSPMPDGNSFKKRAKKNRKMPKKKANPNWRTDGVNFRWRASPANKFRSGAVNLAVAWLQTGHDTVCVFYVSHIRPISVITEREAEGNPLHHFKERTCPEVALCGSKPST